MLGIPSVIWSDKNGNDRGIDLCSRLLRDRIIMVTGEINDELAESVVSQLLYLEAEDKDKPVKMLIQGPGGSVSSGNSIISVMKSISCPVHTIAMGSVASMSALITISGSKGNRSAYPNTEIMLHSISSGSKGTYKDMKVSFEQMQKVQENCMKQIAEACDKTLEEVKKDCDRDFWMSAEESVKFGIMSSIAEKHV